MCEYICEQGCKNVVVRACGGRMVWVRWPVLAALLGDVTNVVLLDEVNCGVNFLNLAL
jgi:hypothetical protein